MSNEDIDTKFEGNCYTRELKYPVKVYKIFRDKSYELKFAEGLEIRKIIVGSIVSFIVIALFIYALIIGNEFVRNIIFSKGIIIIAFCVAMVMFISFKINYGNKSIYRFYKDIGKYYLYKNNSYEHYELIEKYSFNNKIQYTNYDVKSESDNDDFT